jgi:hypothetical protein
MGNRSANTSKMAARVAGVALACALAAACSSTNGDVGYSIFVDPGKYQFHNCAQLAGELKRWTQRERELKDLMDKAEQSTGGAAVSFIAYKADYVAAGEELEQLHYAARNKGCAQDEGWRSSTAIR